MINLPVLVLNQSYEPLNVCRVRRAVVLLYRGKAEMLENGSGFIHAANFDFPVPSVIRLAYMIKRPWLERKLTRLEVFNRDQYICQYCGKETRQLTLDHVIPRRLGGEHTWGNIVSACIACNRHKAGKTPEQAGMRLIRPPSIPRASRFLHVPNHYLQIRSEWQKYLPHQIVHYQRESPGGLTSALEPPHPRLGRCSSSTVTSLSGNSTVTRLFSSTSTVSFRGLLPTTLAIPIGVDTCCPTLGSFSFMV